jgi:hypothetical protein
MAVWWDARNRAAASDTTIGNVRDQQSKYVMSL